MTQGSGISVSLLEDVCIGCTACAKACPTEAIRLRERKAVIRTNRCIDCGVCIDVCPVRAKYARTDPLQEIQKSRYEYKIALVGPEIYGQFGEDVLPELILQGLVELGFDEVYEIAHDAEELTFALQQYISREDIKKPVISFSCPAVVRLIAGRYTDLLDHMVPLRAPMGIAGKRLWETKPAELGIKPENLGLFYLTPCPARATRIRRPLTDKQQYFSGAIAIADIYGDLINAMRKVRDQGGPKPPYKFRSAGAGIAWGASGGEAKALQMEDCMYVDGMDNVLKILDEIERGELSSMNYLELMGCRGGCVGGPLMVDNVFVARNKLKKVMRRFSAREPLIDEAAVMERYNNGYYHHERVLDVHPIDPLAANPIEAIKRIKARQLILETLPGIDCGACGAPNCKALAEDVVLGRAERTDCIFVLFEQANQMAQRVVDWTSKLPISIDVKGGSEEKKVDGMDPKDFPWKRAAK